MMRTSRGILFLKRFVLAALVIAGFVSVSAYASRLHSFGETLAQRVYCTVHAAEKRCQSIQPIVLTETENPAGAVLAETDSVASVPLTEPGVGINTPSPVYTTQSTTDQETKDFLLAYLGISSAMLELIESQKDYLNDRIRGQASRTNDSTNERLSELATLDTGEEGQVLLVQSGVPTWVATSTLGISGGGGSTFTALTDTQNSFTANRIPFTNSGATALTDSANFVFNGTNLGVGSTSPTAKLTIQGAAGQTADLFVIASSTGSQFLTVTADGSIGIGTTTPSELLHIASGNILIEDNQYLKFGTNADALFSYSSTDDQLEVTGGIASYFSGRVSDPKLMSEVYDGDGEFSRLDAAWGSVVSGGYAYVVGSEGFTTIDISGITTPSIYAGDVRAGNAYIDNRLTIGGDVSIKGGVAALNAFLAGDLGTAGRVRFSTFGAGTLQTDASGNVSVSSDERLKVIEGFYTATSSIERILGLAPIQYHWASTTGFDTTTLYTGFSAQNVQEFIPEAVGEDPHGFLTLSDRPILATVVNAIKELWERVTGNTERIEELEEEVALLKKELQSDTKQNSSDTQNDNSTQSDDANDQEDDVTADDESNGEEVIEEESGSEEGVVEEDEVETEETVAEETESDSETDVPVETEEDVVAESTDDTVGETVEEPTA